MDWVQEQLPGLTATATELLTTKGMDVIGAIVVLILGRIVAGWIRNGVAAALRRGSVDATLIPFVAGLVYFVVLAFTIIAVLGIFGIPTASFVAVLGAAGLAVGLALQGSLGNFAAGVMLLLFRPFKVGDLVEAGGTLGRVREIGVFSTTMNTPDNVKVIIPNSNVFGEKIRNLSANENRRVDMVFGVGYDDDLQLARDTIVRIVTQHPRVLQDPPPQVEVSALADSSVNFVVRPWCRNQDYWTVNFDLHRQLKDGLDAAGLNIPYPQRDVHLHQVGA